MLHRPLPIAFLVSLVPKLGDASRDRCDRDATDRSRVC
jgi:hypothetical protein